MSFFFSTAFLRSSLMNLKACKNSYVCASFSPSLSYNESLVKYGLVKLSDARQELVDKRFREVVLNEESKLHSLLLASESKKLSEV